MLAYSSKSSSSSLFGGFLALKMLNKLSKNDILRLLIFANFSQKRLKWLSFFELQNLNLADSLTAFWL